MLGKYAAEKVGHPLCNVLLLKEQSWSKAGIAFARTSQRTSILFQCKRGESAEREVRRGGPRVDQRNLMGDPR